MTETKTLRPVPDANRAETSDGSAVAGYDGHEDVQYSSLDALVAEHEMSEAEYASMFGIETTGKAVITYTPTQVAVSDDRGEVAGVHVRVTGDWTGDGDVIPVEGDCPHCWAGDLMYAPDEVLEALAWIADETVAGRREVEFEIEDAAPGPNPWRADQLARQAMIQAATPEGER